MSFGKKVVKLNMVIEWTVTVNFETGGSYVWSTQIHSVNTWSYAKIHDDDKIRIVGTFSV